MSQDNEQEEGESPITISEDFQKKAHELVSGANIHEVKHLRDRAYDREDELRQEEMKAKNKGGKKSPKDINFSTENCPVST